MERTDILSPNINWPDIFHHVCRDGVPVEVAHGSETLAVIIPPKRRVLMKDLDRLLNTLPSLGDDVDAFEADILEADKFLLPLDDPWER